MAERPLYTLYKNLKAQNYDVPDDYNKFESALTRDGKGVFSFTLCLNLSDDS